MANIALCMLPIMIIGKLKRSYVLGLMAVASGLFILGISFTVSALFSFVPIFEHFGNDYFQMLLLNSDSSRVNVIVAICYGLMIAGLFLLVNQFIAETFFDKNKQ